MDHSSITKCLQWKTKAKSKLTINKSVIIKNNKKLYIYQQKSAMNMKDVQTIKFRQDITCKVHVAV